MVLADLGKSIRDALYSFNKASIINEKVGSIIIYLDALIDILDFGFIVKGYLQSTSRIRCQRKASTKSKKEYKIYCQYWRIGHWSKQTTYNPKGKCK